MVVAPVGHSDRTKEWHHPVEYNGFANTGIWGVK